MPALIAGGVALAGDFMSQSGQQAANKENMALQMQNEQWQTQMSDTAMQRRVADMKAAGLNPMLAAGGSGATVGGVGTASAANPNQAMGQLGSQYASAAQLDTQLRKMDAETANTQADTRQKDSQTQDVIPAQIQNLQSQTGLSTAQTQQVAATIQSIFAGIRNTDQDTALKSAQTLSGTLDAQQKSATLKAMIDIANNNAKLSDFGIAGAQNLSEAEKSQIGKIAAYFKIGAPAINSAVNAAGMLVK